MLSVLRLAMESRMAWASTKVGNSSRAGMM